LRENLFHRRKQEILGRAKSQQWHADQDRKRRQPLY
jgi:hypothetical protein